MINFDAARNIETHVHRIGRTGRMGVDGVTPGTAYTLLTSKDSSFAIDMAKNLQLSGKEIPIDLQRLMETDRDWTRRRYELNSESRRLKTSAIHLPPRNTLGLGHGQKALTSAMISEYHSDIDIVDKRCRTSTFSDSEKSINNSANPLNRISRFSNNNSGGSVTTPSICSSNESVQGVQAESKPNRAKHRWDC